MSTNMEDECNGDSCDCNKFVSNDANDNDINDFCIVIIAIIAMVIAVN